MTDPAALSAIVTINVPSTEEVDVPTLNCDKLVPAANDKTSVLALSWMVVIVPVPALIT